MDAKKEKEQDERAKVQVVYIKKNSTFTNTDRKDKKDFHWLKNLIVPVIFQNVYLYSNSDKVVFHTDIFTYRI